MHHVQRDEGTRLLFLKLVSSSGNTACVVRGVQVAKPQNGPISSFSLLGSNLVALLVLAPKSLKFKTGFTERRSIRIKQTQTAHSILHIGSRDRLWKHKGDVDTFKHALRCRQYRPVTITADSHDDPRALSPIAPPLVC